MSALQSKVTGQVLEAKTATFEADNGQQTYGKIQLLTPDASGEFHQIFNIKVRKEDFGFLPDIAAQKGKRTTLPVTQNVFQGKVSFYLSGEDMPRPQARTATA